MGEEYRGGRLRGSLRPLAYGVYTVLIALALGWSLGVTAEILDMEELIPLSRMLHVNIRTFFTVSLGFHYLRWLRKTIFKDSWTLRPLENSVMVTALSWFAGVGLKAINASINNGGLNQAASLLSDNLHILFFLSLLILYVVAILDKIF